MGLLSKLLPILSKEKTKDCSDKTLGGVSVFVAKNTGTIIRDSEDVFAPAEMEESNKLNDMEIEEPLEWEIRRLPVWMPGDLILDTYEVEDVISGGMGHVYMAKHKKWQVKLAIKSPNEMMLSDRKLYTRILREANSWIEMGLHPNIAYCYYVRNIEYVPHIVVEYVEGGNLRQWIENGKCIDYCVNLDLAIQFCHGMEYAHSKGMIHRDIKPENILMTQDGILKITDFGLVKGDEISRNPVGGDQREAGHGLTTLGTHMGTEGYMAPEQAESAHDVDERADIFSFGVCLYEMFCGNKPYNTTYGPMQQPPAPAELSGDANFSSDLAEILVKCVQWDRAVRYRNFQEIKTKLSDVYKKLFNRESLYAQLELIGLEADGLNNQGVSHWELGNYNKSREYFNKALKKEKLHLHANWNLGNCRHLDYRMEIPELRNEAISFFHNTLLRSGFSEETAKNKLSLAIKKNSVFEALATPIIEHSDSVETVSFSQDGNWIVSGSSDETIRIWKVKSGEVYKILSNEESVTTLSISPDSRFIASAGHPELIKIWDIKTGNLVSSLRVNDAPINLINKIAFSKDSKMFAAGGYDKIVSIWETSTWKLLKELKGHGSPVRSVAFSQSGRHFASSDRRGKVLLYETENWNVIRSFEYAEQTIHDIAFAPDEKAIAIVKSSDIEILEIKNGRLLINPCCNAKSIVFTPDGLLLASIGQDFAIRLWDVKRGVLIKRIECYSQLTALAFSPDGEYFVTGDDDGFVREWRFTLRPELAPAKGYRCLKRNKEVRIRDLDHLQELLLREDYLEAYKKLIRNWFSEGLTKESGYSTVFENIIDRSKKIQTNTNYIIEFDQLEGHRDSIYSIAFSPDGSLLASGSQDHTIRVWDIKTSKTILVLKEQKHCRVAFSNDGRFLAAACDDNQIRIWEFDRGSKNIFKRMYLKNSKEKQLRVRLLRCISGYDSKSSPRSIAFSSDSQFLAATSGNAVMFCEVRTQKLIRLLFSDYGDYFSCVTFSPDNRYIACALETDSIYLINLNVILSYKYRGQEKEDITISPGWIEDKDRQGVKYLYGKEGEKLYSIAFSPDGSLIAASNATSSPSPLDGDEFNAQLWDTNSGSLLRTFTGHTKDITSLIFFLDGKFVATGSLDNLIKIWQIGTGKAVKNIPVFEGGVLSIAFSPRGNLLAVSGHSNTIKVFLHFPYLSF